MADINTVIADILVAQNDAYAVAGAESLSAQIAALQSQVTTLTAANPSRGELMRIWITR